MPARFEARCFAKLNLTLAVGPPVPAGESPLAGMHRLFSWFHAIDLFDDLAVERVEPGDADADATNAERCTITPAPEASFDAGAIDWAPADDLAMKMASHAEQLVGRPLPVRTTLRKRIPARGGLGGGSSDAARMLEALNTLFGLNLDWSRAHELSRGVGSDIVFFLDPPEQGIADPLAPPRPALFRGFGERIERLPRCRADLVLVVPSIGCPTGAVYRAYDELGRRSAKKADSDAIRDAAGRGIVADALCMNELTPAAFAVAPDLRRLHDALEESLEGNTSRDRVHLTGSGSCLFALVEPEMVNATAEGFEQVAAEILPAAVLRTRLV